MLKLVNLLQLIIPQSSGCFEYLAFAGAQLVCDDTFFLVGLARATLIQADTLAEKIIKRISPELELTLLVKCRMNSNTVLF